MHPPSTRRSNWIGRFRPSTGGGRIGQSHRSENTARKWWKEHRSGKKPRFRRYFPKIQWDFAKSSENLTRFDEISPDSVKISLDRREISLKCGFLRRILCKLSPESGNFGRSLVIFQSVRVFQVLGEENRNQFAGIGFWWWRPATDPPEQLGRPDSGLIRSVLRMDRVTGSIWTALHTHTHTHYYYYYYLRDFSCLGSSFFLFKNASILLCLSRDKTKRQSSKNTTLTPTKILPKK